jgi:NAD(P)H dehydrogenase (quinone)
MTILITGASGHLGHLVIHSLLERGAAASDIVAGARTTSKLDDLAALGVRTAHLDYDQPETIAAALEGVDTVLLISGSEPGRRFPGHKNVIDAAVAAGGVQKFVYTSAAKATSFEWPLGAEHKATEEALAASGLPTVILRNNWYTENYAQTLQQAAETGFFIGSAGDGLVASASRKDYADAAAVALLSPDLDGRIFELSGDVAWTHPQLAEAISTVTGREVEYRDLSTEAHAEALRGFGLDEGTIAFVTGLDGNIRTGSLEDTSGELAGLIGRPTTPLVDGLRAL